ncbi:unnamed protein product [Calypogeia fissa]
MANSTNVTAAAKCTYMAATSNGVWQHNDPVNFAFPLLVIQIALVLVVTRTLAAIFKPLRQPRVVAEIIGGVLLGPTALGRNHQYITKIFPTDSITVLDTFANTGLVFFMFMVGLELDLKALRKVGSQALAIAGAGMCLPFAVGAGVSVLIRHIISPNVKFAPFLVFMGVAMAITAFPVLARILAERKLLTTNVGQMAMSAAAVNDVSAWILLALAIALSGSGSGTVVVWVLLCGLAFATFMFVVVKPFMTWVAHQAPENEPVQEIYVCITFALVLIAGFTTDAIGIHSIFGGFLLGLVIPKEGSFAQGIIEKIEDFVSVLLLPLYFASSGLKTNVATIQGAQSWGLLVLVICVACFGKIGGTVLVSQFYTKNFRESLVLGILMNTKGLVELIVLNIGHDRGVLTDEVFAIMVLMALVTTCMTTPILMALYKPARNNVPYTRRQLYQDVSPKEQLRIMTCVHGIMTVPAMINLTETMRGQTTRRMRLYILHLIELSDRPSAIRMVQRARRDGRPFWDENGTSRTDPIVVSYESYERLSKVTVRCMNARCISGFEDMHEDICITAADKRAAIIILPFHKPVKQDGSFETGNTGFRTVNRKVLQYAPCSVGILVDRGLWGPAQVAPRKVDHNAVVLFFGGPDDREAMALGVRMAEHPGVKLKVIQFTENDSHLENGDSSIAPPFAQNSAARSSRHFDSQVEKQLDQELLDSIRQSKDGSKAITIQEVVATDLSESIIELFKETQCDLIIVGRSSRPSPLLASICYKRQPTYSELGLVGDILVFFSSPSSVLVVQQYDPSRIHRQASIHSEKDIDLFAGSLASTDASGSPPV